MNAATLGLTVFSIISIGWIAFLVLAMNFLIVPKIPRATQE